MNIFVKYYLFKMTAIVAFILSTNTTLVPHSQVRMRARADDIVNNIIREHNPFFSFDFIEAEKRKVLISEHYCKDYVTAKLATKNTAVSASTKHGKNENNIVQKIRVFYHNHQIFLITLGTIATIFLSSTLLVLLFTEKKKTFGKNITLTIKSPYLIVNIPTTRYSKH